METGLQLLMRDGAVRVAFHPHLEPDQYAELPALAEKQVTKADLCRAIEEAAKRWRRKVECEDINA